MLMQDKSTYPRPDFIRADWQSLNGIWEFDFDDRGTLEAIFNGGGDLELNRTIQVPFPYQSPASGIGDTAEHPVMWYRRAFRLTAEQTSRRILLHFGAVDHDASVWVNGAFVGGHTGGYTPFEFDISSFVHTGENEITLRAADTLAADQVRGKQYWEPVPAGCHYVAVSGIWQEVWLEFTGPIIINDIRCDVDFDRSSVTVNVCLDRKTRGSVLLSVSKDGELWSETEQTVKGDRAELLVSFPECGTGDNRLYNWSPEHPNLFDIAVTLSDEDGMTLDTVYSYFALRKIHVSGSRIFLNNSHIYLRAVLDQGYWTEGIYRPADDDGFRRDVETTLALGFNCARKHQKIEDPKYYYWADKLGLLVWGELPSFYCFNERSCEDATNTLREFIRRDINHPCIMAWVPFNETWGLRKIVGDPQQQSLARCFYYLCKSMDPSRIVSTNDGWENLHPTDIISVHDYRSVTPGLIEFYSDTAFLQDGSARTGHPYLLPGEQYQGEPILYTEFGGARLANDTGWGYDTPIESVDAFLEAVERDVNGILSMPTMEGYCYTQLTDVYQETNGLLRMDRSPKADIERLASIFGKKRTL